MILAVERWIARHCNLLAAATLVLFVAGSLVESEIRPFWNDEYFTIAVAQQPTLKDAAVALEHGVDLTPPLFHLITRWSTQLVGLNRIGLRLPAVAGFGVLLFVLYRFVSRSFGPSYGLVAMMIPVLTGFEYYSSEGRGYGLTLGFAALAVLAWQAGETRASGWPRSLACAVALCCSIFCHSYAVFLLLPLAVAEIVRSLLQRRWRLHFWCSMILPVATIAFVYGQSRHAMSINGSSFPAALGDIRKFYIYLFEPFAMTLTVLIAAFTVLSLLRSSPSAGDEPVAHPVAADVVLATGLLLLPVFIVPISMFAKLLFMYRYSAISVIGCAILFAWFLRFLDRWRSPSGVVCLVVIGTVFGIHESRRVMRFALHPQPEQIRRPFEDPDAKNLPVFAQDPYLYLEMLFNWPAEQVANLHYVLDPQLSLHYLEQSGTEANIAQLLPVKKLQVETYAELRAKPRQFLLYYDIAMDRADIKGWLLMKLLDDGIPVQLLRRHGSILVYRVTIG
jgi:hypothetical protein